METVVLLSSLLTLQTSNIKCLNFVQFSQFSLHTHWGHQHTINHRIMEESAQSQGKTLRGGVFVWIRTICTNTVTVTVFSANGSGKCQHALQNTALLVELYSNHKYSKKFIVPFWANATNLSGKLRVRKYGHHWLWRPSSFADKSFGIVPICVIEVSLLHSCDEICMSVAWKREASGTALLAASYGKVCIHVKQGLKMRGV